MKRWSVVGWGSIIAVAAVVSAGSGACSSSSSNDSTTTPAVVRPDAGQCTRACCELPQPGQACDSADGGGTSSGSGIGTGTSNPTCTYAVTCSDGLVLARVTECQSNVWVATNDCPPAGGADARGCPASQPAPESPCSVDGGFLSCSYTKKCAQQICDGSDCQSVRSSAAAQCVQGVWKTTPIPPC